MVKKWIQGAIKHEGALHKELGIKQDKKIPKKTLAKAAKKGGKLGKRARLAMTLSHMHHGKKKMSHVSEKRIKAHASRKK